MHISNLDRVLFLCLLAAPANSLPIPPSTSQITNSGVETKTVKFRSFSLPSLTLDCSRLKAALPSGSKPVPTDENLVAALILADQTRDSVHNEPIVVTAKNDAYNMEEELIKVDLDFELEPRHDLRQWDLTPAISKLSDGKESISRESVHTSSVGTEDDLELQQGQINGDLYDGQQKIKVHKPEIYPDL
ncbi:MAG: hypothetical protein Q9227_005288 [Pyrenula ochraceoflavens]